MLFTVWSFLACAAASVIAAPAPLPPTHQVSVPASDPPHGFIIKFKKGKLRQADRRRWVAKRFNDTGLEPLTDERVKALNLMDEWNMFDGLAAKFSKDEIRALNDTEFVEYITEGE